MPVAKPKDAALTKGELKSLVAGRTPEQIGQAILLLAQGNKKRKELDFNKILQLRMAGCLIPEIAAELGVSEKTIDNRLKNEPLFREVFDRGNERGKAAIRTKQFTKGVIEGDMTALIWLGKIRLGQTDRPSAERGSDRLTELFDAVYAKPETGPAPGESPLDTIG